MTQSYRLITALALVWVGTISFVAGQKPASKSKPSAAKPSAAKTAKPADLKSVPDEAKQPVTDGALPPPPPASPPAGSAAAAPPPPPATTGSKPPAPEAGSGEEDPLVKVFGKGGMNLKAVGDGGGMNAEFDPESGEMTAMHIWGQIDMTSELMNLECEDIAIDMVKQVLTAKGQIVKFKKNEVDGQCGRLVYEIESKKTYLYGPPKPLIHQAQPNGDIRRTSADKITMIQNEKSNNILWDGNPELSVVPAPEKNPTATTGPKKPAKIDGGNVNTIRSPAVQK